MLEPLSNTIQGVVNFTWPMIIISVVIIVSLRISYLLKNKLTFVLYKEITMLIFIIYILCLFQVVTFQDEVNWSTNNFIPFKEILRYKISSKLFVKNVLGNLIMFLPFGFFVSYYLNVSKKILPVILSLISSFSIEIVQLAIGRVFDVDDIILNVLGSIIGFHLYNIFRLISEKLPSYLKKEWVLNVFSIIILVSMVYLFIIIL